MHLSVAQECPVKMKLVAPPLYVLTTQTLDKNKGVEVVAAGEGIMEQQTHLINSSPDRILGSLRSHNVCNRWNASLCSESVSQLLSRRSEVHGDSSIQCFKGQARVQYQDCFVAPAWHWIAACPTLACADALFALPTLHSLQPLRLARRA
jgi:hypothetical protein